MIQVYSVRKCFGSTCAVDGATFQARDGSITGLVGPNGSGKTTTLRLLTGMLRPNSGRVLVDGIDPAMDPLGARSRIGALSDALGNYPRLTAREHVRYFGQLRGLAGAELERRIDALLDLFDMGSIADRAVAGFSQGERMKVALARAVVADPPNMLLDEPGNGLDVLSARSLRVLLTHFREAGKCVILSTHLMNEVALVCDHVVMVAHGRVAAEGPPASLVATAGTANLEEAFVALTA